MLDLRGLYFSDPNGSSGEGTGAPGGHVFSDIRFTSSLVVGNLGAPLSHSHSSGFDTDSLDSPSSPTRGDVEATRSRGTDVEDLNEGGKGNWEWYEDEVPAFAADPFAAGMKMQLAIAPRVGVPELELELGLQREGEPEGVASPVSPTSLVRLKFLRLAGGCW